MSRHPADEFGGPIGVTGIIIFSHCFLYYMYGVLYLGKCGLFLPSWTDICEMFKLTLPTQRAAALYLTFIGMQIFFALVMPGLRLKGRPDARGHSLEYLCNAYAAWWCTLGSLLLGHISGVAPLTVWFDEIPHMLTFAVVFANLTSLICYVSGRVRGDAPRMTGNVVYDFFMGAVLHPRVLWLDVKLVAEIRVSWFLLFTNTLAACAKAAAQSETGGVPAPLAFMAAAHFLYANACAKGEHYVPPTWDIYHEKFGWMLCYWNCAGVPFLYCTSPMYLANCHCPELHPAAVVALVVLLFAAYWVWDVANAQKNHFRLASSGITISRRTFPTMPGSELHDPAHVMTARGRPLLCGGCWAYARKPHYTADILMALSWGLVCGTTSVVPYLYVAFFTAMIVHRFTRDNARCSAEYGADWVEYCRRVPYTFLPYII